MSDDRVIIQDAGAICSVGIGLPQVAASVRAGLSRFADSTVHDRWFEPLRMALLPETALEPLSSTVATLPLTARQRRMLQLAAPALREATSKLTNVERAPLFLGLPEPQSNQHAAPNGKTFVESLEKQAACEFNQTASQAFPQGRAAALLALQAGLRSLREKRSEVVIVGGVDTHLDLALLATLDAEQRLLGTRVMDGFIPGEGAAFLVLTSARRVPSGQRAAAVLAVGTAKDQGHRYSDKSNMGEGLAQAIDEMIAPPMRAPAPIRTIFAGLNGESYGAKEWGVARLRHSTLFDSTANIEHPADCFGDTGAAAGALLLALAHHYLIKDQKPGPMLVWSSSDQEDRAAVYLDLLR